MTEEFDIIVVGAGFGGPVAAKLCADAGLKTLMLERSKDVGDKVISGLTIPFQGFLFAPTFIRDGNPPFERPSDGVVNYIIKDIDTGEMEIDDSLRIPKPLSPIIAFGYNTYCKPFCEWEAQKAIDAGAVLRTSTTVVDLIKEDGYVKGVIVDKGQEIRAKIVIDAEGSQGLVAVKAGIREKYPPETISLADTYDYEMPKEDVDRIFGYSLKFCWGWDEQKIAPPLGHGNGLMVWPYRNSIHFMQDQCLQLNEKSVPNLKRAFNEYHRNITTKLDWWKKDIAPRIKLRARMWEGFEIYVGLNKKLRNMSNHADGIILIGDVAGLESTELCDGVPAAWFSAEIAAEVAIEAIQIGDMSREFLKKYDERIKNHPIIQWSISGRNRYDLRKAQETHDEKMLKKYIHNGWGIGALTHFTTPFLKLALTYFNEDPTIATKWIKMFFRYYQNWLHESYDYTRERQQRKSPTRSFTVWESLFCATINMLDSLMKFLRRMKRCLSIFMIPLVNSINKFLSTSLPILEPILLKLLKFLEPRMERISKKMINFVDRANPLIFEVKSMKRGEHLG